MIAFKDFMQEAKMTEREAKQVLKLASAMDKPSSPAMASSMKKDIQAITKKHGKKFSEIVKQAEELVNESTVDEGNTVKYRNVTELTRDFKYLTRKAKNVATINKPQVNATELMGSLARAGFEHGAKFSRGSKKFLDYTNQDVTIQFQFDLDDPDFGQIIIAAK